jgi:precorrin-6B methylase 2
MSSPDDRLEVRRLHRQLSRRAIPYLLETGWIPSLTEGESVDEDGEPIPWLTYPAIAFLAARVRREMHVFEFGSGNSTVWWSRRVNSVTAVEHDPAWVERVRPRLPANAHVDHVPRDIDGDYCRAVHLGGTRFDVVVVDGRDRVNCGLQAAEALEPGGVIVWDNSERRRYAPGLDALAAQGFRRLPFAGLSPLGSSASETSILYREANCLGI